MTGGNVHPPSLRCAPFRLLLTPPNVGHTQSQSLDWYLFRRFSVLRRFHEIVINVSWTIIRKIIKGLLQSVAALEHTIATLQDETATFRLRL